MQEADAPLLSTTARAAIVVILVLVGVALAASVVMFESLHFPWKDADGGRFFNGFWPDLAATFIGAAIGVPVGLAISERAQRDQRLMEQTRREDLQQRVEEQRAREAEWLEAAERRRVERLRDISAFLLGAIKANHRTGLDQIHATATSDDSQLPSFSLGIWHALGAEYADLEVDLLSRGIVVSYFAEIESLQRMVEARFHATNVRTPWTRYLSDNIMRTVEFIRDGCPDDLVAGRLEMAIQRLEANAQGSPVLAQLALADVIVEAVARSLEGDPHD